jgi:DNA adenine methylase
MLPPLFMWAGGKRRLLPAYRPLLPARPTSYVEPFAGSAALFADVALRWPGLPAVLGDSNAELVALYRMVRDAPETLVARCKALEAEWLPKPVAERKSFYYVLRRRYWDLPEGAEATALLYFLMRTGFNGVWQTCRESKDRYGTPVGLAAQRGPVFDPEAVRAWSDALASAEIAVRDWRETPLQAGAFVFCDPPYRGSFADYGCPFSDEDLADLVAWCRDASREKGCTAWLSNRDLGDGFLERLAPDAARHVFPSTYTAGRRLRTEGGHAAKKATEVLLVWTP